MVAPTLSPESSIYTGAPSSLFLSCSPLPWRKFSPSDELRSVPLPTTFFSKAVLRLHLLPYRLCPPVSLSVFDFLNIFSWIQDKHSRAHIFVCFLHAVVFLICLRYPFTSEYWCCMLQACFIWRRGNWIQRKVCEYVSLTDNFYRSLGSIVGTLASRCALGCKLYFY